MGYSPTESDSSLEEDPIKQNLEDALYDCQAPGSFATRAQCHSYPAPGLVIEELGPINVPVSPQDAFRISEKAKQAPFGTITQTLVDDAIRKTGEIDASLVSFKNKAWHDWIKGITVSASQALGIQPQSPVQAVPHKLLVYHDGGHFKAHRDSKKGEGMFGTLVVCLPSEHKGGATHLVHSGNEVVFNSDEDSEFGLSYMAWYADVSHEIRPVHAGYRIVLTYNLICSPLFPKASAAARLTEQQKVTESLMQWNDARESPKALCWLLEHKYPRADLRLANLKGNDFPRVSAILKACKSTGQFDVFFAQVEKTFNRDNDEGGEECQPEVTELSDITTLDGGLLQTGLEIPAEWIVQNHLYRDREFDQRLGGEYVGNQHADFDLIYNDTSVWIVRKCDTPRQILGTSTVGSYQKLLKLLSAFFDEQEDSKFGHELMQRACNLPFAPHKRSASENNRFFALALVGAFRLRDSQLAEKLSDQIGHELEADSFQELGCLAAANKDCVNERIVVGMLHKLRHLHKFWSCLNAFCATFVTRDVVFPWLGDRHDWMLKLVREHMVRVEEVVAEDAGCICTIQSEMPQIHDGTISPFVSRFRESSSFVNALIAAKLRGKVGSEVLYSLVSDKAASSFTLSDYCSHMIEPRYVNRTDFDSRVTDKDHEESGLLRDLYAQLLAEERRDDADLILTTIQSQATSISSYQLGRFVIPLLGAMCPVLAHGSGQGRHCCSGLLREFLARAVRQEPSQPKDWTRNDEASEIRCHIPDCKECAALKDFLLDPKLKQCKFTVSNSNSQDHLYWEIPLYCDKKREDGMIDVTKTNRAYERKHERWNDRCLEAQKLLATLPQTHMSSILGEEFNHPQELRMLRNVQDLPPETLKRKHEDD